MAKEKRTPSKRASTSKSIEVGSKAKLKTDQPVKIIVEVVIRNETGTPDQKLPSGSLESGSERAPNFSFSFDKQNASILKLVVGTYESNLPPDSGDFFTRVFSNNIPVIVYAQQDSSNSFAYLTLKYKGKDVYVPARNIPFRNGKGEIDEIVKLP